MNRTNIYDFVTSLLNGTAIDLDLFNTLLDVAQSNIEGLRPWVILRATDSTQSAGSGNGFLVAKTIPADFSRWYDDDASVVLTDGGNNPLYFRQVPLAKKFSYKDATGVFYADYTLLQFYLCGNLTQSYTINLNYIKDSELVSGDEDNEWVFPSRFHKILGLSVAVYWKLGVDYDIISNAQADKQATQAAAIYDIMSRWDSNLQNSMTRGIDPFNSAESGGWQAGQMRNG